MNKCTDCFFNTVCQDRYKFVHSCDNFIHKNSIIIFDPPINTTVYFKRKECEECEFCAPELRNLGFTCQFGFSDNENVCMQQCRDYIRIIETTTSLHMYNHNEDNLYKLSDKYKLRKEELNK